MFKLGAHEPNFLSRPENQAHAYEYLDSLKKDPHGWSACIEDIVGGKFRNVEEHFFLLQVIEHFLKETYSSNSNDNVSQRVRLLMLNWMERISACKYSTPIGNKMAHIFCLVFVVEFPNRWPRYMQEVFLDQMDPSKVDFFLRFLQAVDKEVVDREIARTKEIANRNTLIKDAMRELCVPDMVRAWHTILQNCNGSEKNLCLIVIGNYVDWIDVDYIANNEMMPQLIDGLNHASTLEGATQAISSVLYKGMDAQLKLNYCKEFYKLFSVRGLLQITQVQDVDEVRRNACLVECLGINLVECVSRIAKIDKEKLLETLKYTDALLEKGVECLRHEDMKTGQQVLEFVKEYVDLLRVMDDDKVILKEDGSVLYTKKQFLTVTVGECIRHWAFPEDLDVNGKGEYELEFQEFRKTLRGLIHSIGEIEPTCVVEKIYEVAMKTCVEFETASEQELETALSLTFHLTDFLSVQFLRSDNQTVCYLVLMVLKSGIANRLVPKVNITFFEIASRFDKIISNDVGALSNIVECYLDARGICHADDKVRARAVYLFCRFVKMHKAFLGPHVGTILTRLTPFLGVGPNPCQILDRNDQAFIFESIATLIVNGDLTPAEKEQYMKELASTLVNKFAATMTVLQQTPLHDSDRREELFTELNSIIGYSSRITKSFTAQNSMDSCNCKDAFVYVMTSYMSALNVENSEALLDSLRQYVHRMVICLDDQLVPLLPELFQKFVGVAHSVKTMTDFLILAQQIVTKYKKKIISIGIDMVGLVHYISSLMEIPIDPSDEIETRNMFYFKRGYIQFCHSLAVNKVFEMIINEGPDFLQNFSESIYRAAQFTDTVLQKTALNALNEIFTNYGYNHDVLNVMWFKAMETAIRVPIAATFNTSDSQSPGVQHEASTLLSILRKLDQQRFDATIGSFIPAEYVQPMIDTLRDISPGVQLNKIMDDMYGKIRRQMDY